MNIFTDGITVSPITQPGLGDGIKSAFVDLLGYTAIDDYSASGIRNLVFTHVSNTKSYGLVFWRITISSAFVVSQSFGTGYNLTTKVLTNAGSVGVAITFVGTSPISFKAIHDIEQEFDYVILYQGQISLILGWTRAATLNEVDENFCCAYVHPLSYSGRTWRGVAAAAAVRSTTSWSTWGGDVSSFNQSSKYDIFPKIAIISISGCLGITSDKLAVGAGNGLPLFSKVGDYTKIWDGGSSFSSWFVK